MNPKPFHRLVLFDVDGTLLRKTANTTVASGDRFVKAIEEVFGFTPTFDWKAVDGMGDRRMTWEMIKTRGVSHAEFVKKFPHIKKSFVNYLHQEIGKRLDYECIPEAKALLNQLVDLSYIARGVLTGNIEMTTRIKLEHVGLKSYFAFGLFADDAEDRNELARSVFTKAKEHFGQEFAPHEIVIIGDTTHDIHCGKAIGAVTVAVTTGLSASRESLAGQSPNLLVDTLADPRVLQLIAS